MRAAAIATRDNKPTSKAVGLPSTRLIQTQYQFLLRQLGYLSEDEIRRVEAACTFAEAAHAEQTRISGDPYVTHPLAVASTIAEWRMDSEAVIVALLHDVLEDTGVVKEQIKDEFGSTVAELVDGLSKLDRLEFSSYHEAQAENFRKMLMAMARDLRIIMIKLADRRHNLVTLGALRTEKRRRIAKETLDIYSPIASRLGLYKLYQELNDLAFSHIYPNRASVLARALRDSYGKQRELFSRVEKSIIDRLKQHKIRALVAGREKGLYSLYRKMHEKNLRFDQVLDIYGFRVITVDINNCYLALGALHSLYKPVPGRFKDYVAIPRANGYQSLHTTLIGPYGTPIEVQIRTEAMNYVAQEGVASHWLYKDKALGGADLQLKTHKWLQSLLDMQSGDSSEFLENFKVELFPDEVYVFTPRGHIMSLPRGATPVDMAYMVHTDVGHGCIGARINQELVPLRTELRNGDQVEILTMPYSNPSPAWLGFVRTGRARSNIRHFLRTRQHKESSVLGENMLAQELNALGIVPSDVTDIAWQGLLKNIGARSIKDIYTDIGLGRRLAAVIARRLLAVDEASPPVTQTTPLTIRGAEGMAVHLAHCCYPIPGDAIIGSIRKGHGLVVHQDDCTSVQKWRLLEPAKWIAVEWDPEPGRLFEARIKVEVENVRGVLANLATSLADSGSNIEQVSMTNEAHQQAALHFNLLVTNRQHLAQIMRQLRHLPHVKRLSRERQI